MDHYWREIEQHLDALRSPMQNLDTLKRILPSMGALLRVWFLRFGVSPGTAAELSLEAIKRIAIRFQEFDERRDRRQGQFQEWCEELAEGILRKRQLASGATPIQEQVRSIRAVEAIGVVLSFLSDAERCLIYLLLSGANEDAVAECLGVPTAELWQHQTVARISATLSRFRDLLEMDPDIRRWLGQVNSAALDE